jgi:hypothetical protein
MQAKSYSNHQHSVDQPVHDDIWDQHMIITVYTKHFNQQSNSIMLPVFYEFQVEPKLSSPEALP